MYIYIYMYIEVFDTDRLPLRRHMSFEKPKTLVYFVFNEILGNKPRARIQRVFRHDSVVLGVTSVKNDVSTRAGTRGAMFCASADPGLLFGREYSNYVPNTGIDLAVSNELIEVV